MNQNLAHLEQLLKSHDWQYEFSDDHSVWKRGSKHQSDINSEQRRLVTEGKATVDEILELVNKYRPNNI